MPDQQIQNLIIQHQKIIKLNCDAERYIPISAISPAIKPCIRINEPKPTIIYHEIAHQVNTMAQLTEENTHRKKDTSYGLYILHEQSQSKITIKRKEQQHFKTRIKKLAICP